MASSSAFSLFMVDVNLERSNPFVNLEYLLGSNTGPSTPPLEPVEPVLPAEPPLPPKLPPPPAHSATTVFGASPHERVFDSDLAAPGFAFSPLPASPQPFYPHPTAGLSVPSMHRTIEVPPEDQQFSISRLRPDVMSRTRGRAFPIARDPALELEEREMDVRRKELDIAGREVVLHLKEQESRRSSGIGRGRYALP